MNRRQSWAARASRRNAALRRRYPLLAWGGLLPEETAESYRARVEAQAAALDSALAATARWWMGRIAELRAEAAARLPPEQVAALDEYVRRSPWLVRGLAYQADLWRSIARVLDGDPKASIPRAVRELLGLPPVCGFAAWEALR